MCPSRPRDGMGIDRRTDRHDSDGPPPHGNITGSQAPSFSLFLDRGRHGFTFLFKNRVELAGGVPTGVAAHYLIGPLVGALFGAAAAMFPALQVSTPKKARSQQSFMWRSWASRFLQRPPSC
jgi:hypothetical protein